MFDLKRIHWIKKNQRIRAMKCCTVSLLGGLLFSWIVCVNSALSEPPSFTHCEWITVELQPDQAVTNHCFTVNCSGQNLFTIPSALPNWINCLDMSFNSISSIQHLDFSTHVPHMKSLNLSYNSLAEIAPGTFSACVGLEELDLSSNSLHSVTDEMFRGLRNLKVLDLRDNGLVYVHPRAFSHLISLESLWLQKNSLNTVPEAVNALAALNILSLGINRISELDSKAFHGCLELRILHLESNQISTVYANAFRPLHNLEVLDLSSNHLQTVPAPAIKVLWERGVNLHLYGNAMRCHCGVEDPAWLADSVLCKGKMPVERQLGSFQIEKTVSIHVLSGKVLELQCKNKSNEVVLSWQTPFGQFDHVNPMGKRDPVKTMCDGSLRISEVTLGQSGLYFCLLANEKGRKIISYQVKILDSRNVQTARMRVARGAEVLSGQGVSEGHFIAAVTSSVLVTFLGAFVLGIFSRSHVIKCLKRVRLHLPHKWGSSQTTSELSQYDNMFFHRNMNPEEETVDMAPRPSPPKAPRTFLSEQDAKPTERQQDGPNSGSEGQEDTIDNESHEKSENGGTEEQESQGTSEEQVEDGGQEDSQPPQAKRRSRVIKLYNYDEDGNRYGHIKETEEEEESVPRPKQRALSLTRLNAIMSKVGTSDFTTNHDHETEMDQTSSDKPVFKMEI